MPEKTIARLAAARGRAVWLVGGPVRDRLLGLDGGDLDFALDGAVREIGRAAARALGGNFRWHPRFLTGTIEHPGGRVDLARTRKERYAAPAALPAVRPGSIEDDLARRDFTINAMALELRGRGRGRLLDPLGGRADLAGGTVRILHDRSFLDDPTRAFRAWRFAVRFGFRLAPGTRRRLDEAVAAGAHLRLSGERVANELRRALLEPRPGAVLAAFSRAGLDACWGGASVSPRLRHAARRRAALEAPAALLFGCAWGPARRAVRRELAERLRLTRAERRALVDGPPRAAALARRIRAARGRPALDRVCSRAAEEDLRLAALSADGPTFARIARWWRGARQLRLAIDGNDLRAAGMAPGPAVARALRRAREALVAGRAPDRDAQLRAALGT